MYIINIGSIYSRLPNIVIQIIIPVYHGTNSNTPDNKNMKFYCLYVSATQRLSINLFSELTFSP